jgi:PAS domain-containing protein
MTTSRRTRSEAAALAALLLSLPAPALAQGSAAPDVSLTAIAVVAVAGAMVVAVVSLSLALSAWAGARRRERRDGARIRELEDAVGRRASVLDSAPVGRFEWAASSGLEICSSGLAQLLRAPPVAANAFRDLAPYFDSADYSALDAAAALLRSGGTPFDIAAHTATGLALEARGRLVAGAGGEPQAHVIWFRDITTARNETSALEEAVKQMRGERDRLQEVLDRAPFPAWRRQPDLAIAWANRAYCAAVEADLDTVVRDSIEFVPGAAPKQSRALAAMARQTGAAQTDQRRFAVAGERRTYEITEIPLSGDETAGIVRDVTGREDA